MRVGSKNINCTHQKLANQDIGLVVSVTAKHHHHFHYHHHHQIYEEWDCFRGVERRQVSVFHTHARNLGCGLMVLLRTKRTCPIFWLVRLKKELKHPIDRVSLLLLIG